MDFYEIDLELELATLANIELSRRKSRVDAVETVEADLLRQQDVLAKFAELALRSDDLDQILNEACRLVGEALGTDLAKVMELQKDGITLFVRAGVGWKSGVVGRVTVKAEVGSSERSCAANGKASNFR